MATSEDYTPRSAYSHRLGEEEGRGPGSSAAGDFSVHPHPGATTAPSSEGLAGGVDAVTVAQVRARPQGGALAAAAGSARKVGSNRPGPCATRALHDDDAL